MQLDFIGIFSIICVCLASFVFGLIYFAKYIHLVRVINFEEEANELNYEFLSTICPNEEFMWTSMKDGKSHSGCICINNSPSQRKMYCKFRYNGGVFGTELLKYSDPRFMNVFVLNRSEDENLIDEEPTCSDVLNAELQLLEAEEKYEEAAILKEAVDKIKNLSKK